MSTVRCVVEKSLLIAYKTVLAAHINLSVGSACHNALCSTNDATITHMPAVRNVYTLCFIQLFVDEISQIHMKDTIGVGKRYLALLHIKI